MKSQGFTAVAGALPCGLYRVKWTEGEPQAFWMSLPLWLGEMFRPSVGLTLASRQPRFWGVGGELHLQGLLPQQEGDRPGGHWCEQRGCAGSGAQRGLQARVPSRGRRCFLVAATLSSALRA